MRGRLLVLLGSLWLVLSAIVLVREIGRPPEIIVHWVTETEMNTAGFNLYRAGSPDGPFERLNNTLIFSEGAPLTGAEYEFIDTLVERDQSYYYQLEEVEVDGQINKLDLIRATVQPVETLVVILGITGLVIGGYLVAIGLYGHRTPALVASTGRDGERIEGTVIGGKDR